MDTSNKIESIARLVNEFSKLPGVGKKTAERYAYYVIKLKSEEAQEFADAIVNCKNKIKFCEICGNFTENNPCDNCTKKTYDTICVVKEPKDVAVIEKSNAYNGAFHVLHGTISPMQGVGPNDIRIKELLSRVNNNDIKEVIIATNPDVEGEATALYIAKLLKPLGIKVSRIAQGVAMGSDLQFADSVTLSKAISDRKEL